MRMGIPVSHYFLEVFGEFQEFFLADGLGGVKEFHYKELCPVEIMGSLFIETKEYFFLSI